MKLILLTAFLPLWCIPAGAGQLYKVVQEDGSVVYTDIPTEDAKPFDLSQANSAVMPAYDKKKSHLPDTKQDKKASPAYQLEILQPTERQTLRNNSGDMTVVAQITPRASGLVQLFMDGELLVQQANLTFNLHNIDRGEHHISVKLVNQSGKLIASSQDRVFYLHRASVINRAN